MTATPLDRARLALELGRAAEALRLVSPQLAENPDDGAALTVASSALRHLGRNEEAVDAAERAVGLRPLDAGAWDSLAFARQASGDLDGAVTAATRATQLVPAYWLAHSHLAVIASKATPRGDLALKSAREAVRLAPQEPQAHQVLGHVLFARDRRPEPAADAFREALRLDPQNKAAREGLAFTANSAGELAAAVVDLARISGESPGDTIAAMNFRVAIGWIVGRLQLVVFIIVLLELVAVLRLKQLWILYEDAFRLGLLAVAALTPVGTVAGVISTNRKLGSFRTQLLDYVLRHDRLLLVWAISSILGLVCLLTAPLVDSSWWYLSFGLSFAWVMIGLGIGSAREKRLVKQSAVRPQRAR